MKSQKHEKVSRILIFIFSFHRRGDTKFWKVELLFSSFDLSKKRYWPFLDRLSYTILLVWQLLFFKSYFYLHNNEIVQIINTENNTFLCFWPKKEILEALFEGSPMILNGLIPIFRCDSQKDRGIQEWKEDMKIISI